MKTIQDAKCEITVKRPNGQIETLIHPTIKVMVEGILTQANAAMKAANRGEIINYKNISAIIEKEEKDYLKKCERCGKIIDVRKVENENYCDSCWNLIEIQNGNRI